MISDYRQTSNGKHFKMNNSKWQQKVVEMSQQGVDYNRNI